MFTNTSRLHLIQEFVSGGVKAMVFLKDTTSGQTPVIKFARCFQDGRLAFCDPDQFFYKDLGHIQTVSVAALAYLKLEAPL